MMNDKTMMYFTTKKIDKIFSESPIEAYSNYHIKRGNGGRITDMWVDVTLKFRITESELMDIEDKLPQIRKLMLELNGTK